MAVGTTQQFLFPLIYDDPSQGTFDAALTDANFYVGKKLSTPEADAVIALSLNAGIAEETIDGIRHLVVSLSPSDSDNVEIGGYFYSAVIEWGASARAVIARDVIMLQPWVGHSAAP